mmetsp:Transcript_27031/g.62935  ORF Transcript_27031/g.62935 Transcript_27031/m.62935 type:complete len:85 (+) Transcript_27031:481-735(+)
MYLNPSSKQLWEAADKAKREKLASVFLLLLLLGLSRSISLCLGFTLILRSALQQNATHFHFTVQTFWPQTEELVTSQKSSASFF